MPIRRLRRKQSLVVGTPGRMYKLTWGFRATLLQREFTAASSVERDGSVYRDLGTFYRPVGPRQLPFILARSDRLRGPASKEQVDDLAQELLDRIPGSTRRKPWYETLDRDQLDGVLAALDREQAQLIETVLESIELPVTGAHGDLCDRHVMITSRGEARIIDWEFFRSYGSVVTDILRLYSIRFRERENTTHLNATVLHKHPVPARFSPTHFGLSELPSSRVIGVLAAVSNACIPGDPRELAPYLGGHLPDPR